MPLDPLHALTEELQRRVLESARQRNARLAAVTVRVPSGIDAVRLRDRLEAALQAEGLVALSVAAVRGAGAPEILALEFER